MTYDTSRRAGRSTDRLAAAYRERNAVIAALLRVGGYPVSVMPAADAEGWWLVYAETPIGQVSWHVSPVDIRLFDGFPRRAAEWDGHTTDEKYERVALLAAPPADDAGGLRARRPVTSR